MILALLFIFNAWAQDQASVFRAESPGAYHYLNPFKGIYFEGEKSFQPKKDESYSLALKFDLQNIFRLPTYKRYGAALRKESDLWNSTVESLQAKKNAIALIEQQQLKEEKELLQEWQSSLEKARAVSKLESKKSDSNLKSILKSKFDLEKTTQEIGELKQKLVELEAKGTLNVTNISSLKKILEVSELEKLLNRVEGQEYVSLTAEQLQADLITERAKIQYDQSISGKLLDSLKIESQREQGKKHEYAFSITFSLPFLASADLGSYRDSLKLAKLEEDSAVKIQDSIAEQKSRTGILRAKLAEFHSLEEESVLTKKSMAIVLSQDPSLALELQRGDVARKLRKSQLLSEIRIIFIELLCDRGDLAKILSENS